MEEATATSVKHKLGAFVSYQEAFSPVHSQIVTVMKNCTESIAFKDDIQSFINSNMTGKRKADELLIVYQPYKPEVFL